MNNLVNRMIARLAPGLVAEIRRGRNTERQLAELAARVGSLEAEVRELRGDLQDRRRDSLRIAELYDLVVDAATARDK